MPMNFHESTPGFNQPQNSFKVESKNPEAILNWLGIKSAHAYNILEAKQQDSQALVGALEKFFNEDRNLILAQYKSVNDLISSVDVSILALGITPAYVFGAKIHGRNDVQWTSSDSEKLGQILSSAYGEDRFHHLSGLKYHTGIWKVDPNKSRSFFSIKTDDAITFSLGEPTVINTRLRITEAKTNEAYLINGIDDFRNVYTRLGNHLELIINSMASVKGIAQNNKMVLTPNIY